MLAAEYHFWGLVSPPPVRFSHSRSSQIRVRFSIVLLLVKAVPSLPPAPPYGNVYPSVPAVCVHARNAYEPFRFRVHAITRVLDYVFLRIGLFRGKSVKQLLSLTVVDVRNNRPW